MHTQPTDLPIFEPEVGVGYRALNEGVEGRGVIFQDDLQLFIRHAHEQVDVACCAALKAMADGVRDQLIEAQVGFEGQVAVAGKGGADRSGQFLDFLESCGVQLIVQQQFFL